MFRHYLHVLLFVLFALTSGDATSEEETERLLNRRSFRPKHFLAPDHCSKYYWHQQLRFAGVEIASVAQSVTANNRSWI